MNATQRQGILDAIVEFEKQILKLHSRINIKILQHLIVSLLQTIPLRNYLQWQKGLLLSSNSKFQRAKIAL